MTLPFGIWKANTRTKKNKSNVPGRLAWTLSVLQRKITSLAAREVARHSHGCVKPANTVRNWDRTKGYFRYCVARSCFAYSQDPKILHPHALHPDSVNVCLSLPSSRILSLPDIALAKGLQGPNFRGRQSCLSLPLPQYACRARCWWWRTPFSVPRCFSMTGRVVRPSTHEHGIEPYPILRLVEPLVLKPVLTNGANTVDVAIRVRRLDILGLGGFGGSSGCLSVRRG